MKNLRWLPLSVFGLLAFFLGFGLSLDPQKLPTSQLGQNLPSFDLPRLADSPNARFTPDLFQGHMSVLVVWASWCEACRDEQAFLMKLAQKKSISLYGLNYKDNPEQAKQWLAEWGNPYQVVGSDRQGKLALDLGVYGTPETYLIDQQGKIRHRYVGLLNEAIWQKEFLPLL